LLQLLLLEGRHNYAHLQKERGVQAFLAVVIQRN
jgi:hypothetical protein